MEEKKTAVPDARHQEPPRAEWDSVGFSPAEYNQIILFRDERMFLEALTANQNMEAIFGNLEFHKDSFPGVYVAGVKANSPKDRPADNPSATQI